MKMLSLVVLSTMLLCAGLSLAKSSTVLPEMDLYTEQEFPKAVELDYSDYVSPLAEKAWGDTGSGLASVLPGFVIWLIVSQLRRVRRPKPPL